MEERRAKAAQAAADPEAAPGLHKPACTPKADPRSSEARAHTCFYCKYRYSHTQLYKTHYKRGKSVCPEAKKLRLLTEDKQEINLLVAKARKGFALDKGMRSSLKTRYHGEMLVTPDMKVKVDREIADTGMDPWHQVDLLCDAVMEYSQQPLGQHKVCMEVL